MMVPLLRVAQVLRIGSRLDRPWIRRALPRLAAAAALVPEVPDGRRAREAAAAGALTAGAPTTGAPATGVRARVGILTGCVQSVLFPQVNEATRRVLQAEGCEAVVPANQGCCGALSLHAGREDEARRFARALMVRFDPAELDAIVTNAAGCGSTLKQYGDLFASDPAWAGRAAAFSAKVLDVTQWLVQLGPRAPRHEVAAVVAYHDACHLSHAQQVRSEPRALLEAVPGLELREIPDGEMCCGSAGIYNLLEPQPAQALGDAKASCAAATGADVLVAGNPGCIMQIKAALERRGTSMRVMHTIEVLDASLRGPGAGAVMDPAGDRQP